MASTSDVLKNKPNQKDLDQISKRAGNNWRSLLTQLGEDRTTVEGFLLSPSSNTIEACFKGLVHWLEGNADKPVSWETLLKALTDADMKGYAEYLKKELKGPSQDNTRQRQHPLISFDVPASDRSDSDTTDQRNKVKSQNDLTKSKAKEIVHRYWERKEDVSLPCNPKLEKKYDDIISSMKISLQSAKPRVRSRIHHKVCSTYNRLVHGVRPTPLPKVAETSQGLYMFIAEKSTFCEVFLVEEAITELNNEKLKEVFFTEYKPELQKFLEERLASCQQKKVSLPQRADHVHTAVVTNEEALLSLILHLKAYFIACLELQECLFEGFQDGCLVLYFAITATDAVFLASKILSHLPELKRRFSITHIVVFGHFAVDIDQGSVELLSVQNKGSNQVDGKEKSKKLSPRSTVVRRGSDDEKSIEDSEDFRTKGLKHVPLLKSGIFHHEKPEWRLQRFSDEYPQLFEYILIVEIEKDVQNGHLKPVITYQFPKKEDHYMAKGDVLLSQIPQFCFPDLENIKSSKKSERFSFVLTDITGSRRFGYCRRIKRGHPYPEVFCIISPLGCFEMYDKILDEIEQRRVVSRNAVFTFLKAIYNNPFPAPGRTVAVKVLSPTGKGKSLESEEIQFTRPMSSRLEHVDFGELFMTTTVKKVIYMFSSLLLERRVILTAKKLSSLTSCCHAMAALLYPLSWQHVYIPVLPNAVIDMVCSPTPFFVGISPQAARKMESMDVEDVLMVDLDSSKRLMKIGDKDALLPSYVMSFLVDSLESLLSSTPESKRTNSEKFNSQVSDIFLQVLVYFLGRAPSYLHRSGDGFSFQQNSYLDSLHGAAEKEFMRVVTTTQMFDRFLEERENAIMRGKPLNGHFEQKIEEFGSLPLNPEQYFRVEGRSKKKSGIFFKAKH